MTPTDRATLVREIQLLTEHIACEFRPDAPRSAVLPPGVQVPEPDMVSLATLRKLHRALESSCPTRRTTSASASCANLGSRGT